mgnify:CR=1 FL=1
MRLESQQVEVHGHRLHRLIMHPESDVSVRANALFYHGQGDYAERYPCVLDIFTRHGIRCMVTDLPGHGHSPGRRGHCGDEKMLDAVIRSSLEAMGDLPYGVMGHSMGGLLAARHLVLAGKGLLPSPDFCWLSSPLVSPGNGRSPMFRKLAGWIAPWLPWLTINTGVTTAMCRVVDDAGGQKTVTVKPKHELWHRRVSLAWGIFLLNTADFLDVTAGYAAEDTSLLITQGGADTVCPPENARALFDRLGCKKKDYVEIEDMLHEPFAGVGRARLFEALEKWLSQLPFLK